MKTNKTYNRRHRMKKNKTKIQLRKLTRCTDPTQKPWGGQELFVCLHLEVRIRDDISSVVL
jgi:hypothetical protein